MYFRHGALVVKGGKVMALGKNSSEQIKHGERYCSIHSEIDAMSRFECGFKEEGEKQQIHAYEMEQMRYLRRKTKSNERAEEKQKTK